MNKWTITIYYFDKLTVGGRDKLKGFNYDEECMYSEIRDLKTDIFREGLRIHNDVVKGLSYEIWIAPAQIVGITISERQ